MPDHKCTYQFVFARTNQIEFTIEISGQTIESTESKSEKERKQIESVHNTNYIRTIR